MPTAPTKPAADPRAQLSSGYWDRVARQGAIDRAARPDPAALDAKDRAINDYIAPPGPRDGSNAYKKGGAVRKFQGGGFLSSMAEGINAGDSGDLPTKKAKAPASAPSIPTDAGTWKGGAYPDPAGAATNAAAAADTVGAGTGQTYRKGGMVKAGSPRVSAPCNDTKTCRR